MKFEREGKRKMVLDIAEFEVVLQDVEEEEVTRKSWAQVRQKQKERRKRITWFKLQASAWDHRDDLRAAMHSFEAKNAHLSARCGENGGKVRTTRESRLQ